MKESSHYYTKTGEPMYWVPKKDGSGNRPTTIADCRKLNLLPSVTQILRILDKPALKDWLIRQAVMAVCTAPDIPGEGLDEKITRVLDVERQQEQESQQAMDRGTEMHAALESLFKGEGGVDTAILPWVVPAFQAVSALGKTVATEYVVVGDGYAGKFDLMQKCTDHILDADVAMYETIRLWDFKTTKKLPTKGAWPEHVLQLSAYAAASEHFLPIKTGNVYISTVNQGEFVICEHDGWRTTYEQAFEPLVRVWQYLNDYRP